MNTENKTVAALVEKGLTPKLAWSVSMGRMTWSDAVARMAIEDKASRLVKKYAISRAIAIQVSMGKADLVPILKRRSLDKYRETNANRSVLSDSQLSQEPLLMAIVGGNFRTIRVVSVQQYDVTVSVGDATDVVPKLSIKYAYAPEHVSLVRELIRRKSITPTVTLKRRPQHRFHIKDELLMLAVKNGSLLKMTLCDGESLRAPLQWFSRFEFSVDVGGGASLVIFRHALTAARLL